MSRLATSSEQDRDRFLLSLIDRQNQEWVRAKRNLISEFHLVGPAWHVDLDRLVLLIHGMKLEFGVA